jgi:hypothetical protein
MSKSASCATRVRKISVVNLVSGRKTQRPTKHQKTAAADHELPCKRALSRASSAALLAPLTALMATASSTLRGE